MEELLFSLLFTILIELITSIILGINRKIDLLYIVIINILTNPFAEYINLLVQDNNFHYPIIFLIEIFMKGKRTFGSIRLNWSPWASLRQGEKGL